MQVNDGRKNLMIKMCVVYKIVRTYYLQCTRICNFGCEILVFDISLCMYEHERAQILVYNAIVKKITAMRCTYLYSNRGDITRKARSLFELIFVTVKSIIGVARQGGWRETREY
jgi:hypothetical protein